MRIRKALALSLWFKLVVLIMCASILYINYALGDSYFNSLLSTDQQQQAVQSAVDVDIYNNLGLTGLMFAAINGEQELARSLIARAARLNLVSPDEQQTALHYAMNNLRAPDSMAVGSFLVDAYASTRLKNKYGNTPLHLVLSTDVLEDRQKMVDLLMKNGTDINAQTDQGDTLLHLAVNLQAYNWVPVLIGKYGSIMSRTIKNKKGLTPKEYALQLGYGDMANIVGDVQQALIAPSAYDSQGLTGLMLAIMGGDKKVIEKYAKDTRAINLLSNDRYQNSALHVALMNENSDAIAALLASGANVTLQNAKGEVPVQYIVRVIDQAKKIKALEMLLKKSPDTILAQNKRGDALVHYLVWYDDLPSLNYLAKKYKSLLKKTLAIKNKALDTPVSLANRLSRPAFAKLMQSLTVR